jgi:hypothetical protein
MRLSHFVCRESNSALGFQREKGNIAQGATELTNTMVVERSLC